MRRVLIITIEFPAIGSIDPLQKLFGLNNPPTSGLDLSEMRNPEDG